MSCAVKCNVTSWKVELEWPQSLEKKSNYDNGGAWEVKIDEIGSKH